MKLFTTRLVLKTPRSGRLLCVWLAASLLLSAFVLAQGTQPLDRDAILGHLNASINWYRNASGKVQTVGLPSDELYQDNAQNLASQVVRLAFESARSEAQLISAANNGAGNDATQNAQTPTQEEKLAQFAAQVKTKIEQDQKQLDALDKQLAS